MITLARAGIREIRDRFSKYIDRVRRGEEIIVTDRGRDVAVIRPVRSGDSVDALLDRLQAEGVIEPMDSWEPLEPYSGPPIGGKPLSEYVIEERESGW